MQLATNNKKRIDLHILGGGNYHWGDVKALRVNGHFLGQHICFEMSSVPEGHYQFKLASVHYSNPPTKCWHGLGKPP